MRPYLAEAIGTFVLVFGGCGAAVLAATQIGPLGVALAFGFALIAMGHAIGPISGCHINPAVTVGLVIAKRIAPRRALGYVTAQIVGGIAAAAVLLIVANGLPAGFDAAASGFASNGYGDRSPQGYGVLAAFLIEIVLTFFLIFTVLGVTDDDESKGFAGVPIGFVLALAVLVGLPVTNASINPARSIGPALFAGGPAIAQLWLFILAPLCGAVLAAFTFNALKQTAK